MNHGGLGYISKDGFLELSPDLLELISLNISENLFMVFYPPDEKNTEYDSVNHPYNFMLSPVPPKFWPISARLMMFCKHESGTYKKITECLRRENVSIIHSEVSKAGHRYASLSFFIVFENLLNETFTLSDYDYDNSVFFKTKKELDKVEAKLKKECSSTFFCDNTDAFLNNPINLKPNTHLAYFHRVNLENKENNSSVFKPFAISVQRNNINNNSWKFDLSNELRRILKSTNKFSKSYTISNLDDFLPAVVFSNLDTRLLCQRMVVIPNIKKHLFSIFVIKYLRNIEEQCNGLIAMLCERFYPKYRIWWSYNNNYNNNEDSENGYVVFLVENTDTDDSKKTCEAKFEELIAKINDLKNDIDENNGIDIIDVDNYNLDVELAKARINEMKNQDRNYKFRYDVFISADVMDEPIAENIYNVLREKGVKPFYHKKDLHIGDDLEEIKNALLNSRELCLVYSNHTSESLWVSQEWGIAWALNKKIVPICSDSTQFEKLDYRIKKTLGIEVERYMTSRKDIEKYCEDVLTRKYEYLLFSSWR